METFEEIAKSVRRDVLEMIYEAQTSHIGSNFSAIDILVVLFDLMTEKDNFILSKSWAAASVYSLLARRGDIPKEDLKTYCKENSPLIGLINHEVPGVEFGSGAMGHGLPVAVGMALAKKRNGEKGNVYCLMSDGEMNCGTTWECALFAAHHELDNLVVVVDYNKFQAMGKTNEILNLEPLIGKWNMFNWWIRSCDGHNFTDIHNTLVCSVSKMPHMIIADTIKGKGVSFMEDKLEWHYKAPNSEEYQQALKELE